MVVRRVVQCKRLSCMVLRMGKVVTDDTFSRGQLGSGHLEYDPCVHDIGIKKAQFQWILASTPRPIVNKNVRAHQRSSGLLRKCRQRHSSRGATTIQPMTYGCRLLCQWLKEFGKVAKSPRGSNEINREKTEQNSPLGREMTRRCRMANGWGSGGVTQAQWDESPQAQSS